jgi:hypothetical protein
MPRTSTSSQWLDNAPWRRLRVGEHRVLYRELADEADACYLVARVIDRRDLHRTIDKL